MKIEIKGPIIGDADQWIYDWFEIPATSPSKVNSLIEKAIQNQDKELLVLINSGGGSVFSASEIYTALKSFSGKVKTRIVGLAASAASVIATAGYCEMAPTGQLMIHNASTSAWGDYRDMDDTSNFLQKVNQTIVNAYKMKTNKTDDELKELMNKTTWMTAQEAKEMGFIDEIMFEGEAGAVASVEHPELVDGVIPRKVIDQLRQQLKQDPINTVTNLVTKNDGGNEKMDLEKLKNDYPELYKQVKNEGFEEGKKAENARIKGIEELSLPGNETLINQAKFEKDLTAEQLAVEIIKAEKAKGGQVLNNLKDDAQPLNNVPGSEAAPKASDDDKVVAEFESIWGGSK